MSKISIITPIYCDISQKVDWLDEMIQSIQNQTLTDWEIILINDKSPLSLDPVKMKYATDSRLRWFENAGNFGPAMTRNTAVALAENKCILPVDADDMLVDKEALEYMYDAWIMDTTKTVYGDVQVYKPNTSGLYERSKVHQLASYSFEGVMNLQFGIMPVTTMHSKKAHYAAGGWKADLEYGREDLEYWIACGKAGYCGQNINRATLLYRKHEESRDYKLKFENNQLETMQQKIKAMHSDIYRGDYPMACCGKEQSTNVAPTSDPVVISQQAQSNVRIVSPLEGYNESDLEWVAYRGPKMGSSGSILTRGPVNAPNEYPILGNGHVFQIHKAHRKLFEERQHLGYVMNEPDPRKQSEPEPAEMSVVKPEPQVIEVPKPKMSTIVRLDPLAAQTREVDIQEIVRENFEPIAKAAKKMFEPLEVIIEPNPAQSYSDTMSNPVIKEKYPLSSLDLSETLTERLNKANWTVEDLAKATPQKLSSLPGIGIKRANAIIAKAQGLVSK